MSLSSELLSQFAKVVTEETKPSTGITVNGTAVEYDGTIYVRIDGSDQLTPVISSTAGMKSGDRVTVLIKDHSATVTGNTSSPSASQDEVEDVKEEIGNKITEVEILIADKVSTEQFDAEKGRIDELVSDNVTIKEQLTATEADIGKLEADNVLINQKLTAAEAEIDDLKATKIDAEIVEANYATIENLEATNANIHNLEADYGEFKELATDKFEANEAAIGELETEKLSAEEATLLYANIDFANIGKAAIENFFSKSGMIGDLVVGDGTITGTLVGVTIKGDLIEGGTVVADKLVIKGSDGLFYKLNTDGVTTSAEQTEYNSLSGTVITAKSITAEKVAVDDLVAFDATIGGFNITENSLYSGVKETVNNTTRGVYLDDTGQVAFGDQQNFLKYYKDADGTWKLEISAGSIRFGTSNKSVEEAFGDTIVSSVEQFYQSDSPTSLTGGSWSPSSPVWTEGKYIWRRTKVTYGDGSGAYLPDQNGVCITGNTGATGPAGAAGKGISAVTNYYLASASSSGVTTSTTGWTTTIQNMTSTLRYLWNYEKITYTDKSTSSTSPIIIGVYGATGSSGAAGKGIKSITEYYLVSASNSGVTTSTSGWTTTLQTTSTSKRYLWNYEKITYTDNSTSNTSTRIIGTHGETGADGIVGAGGNLVKNGYGEYLDNTNFSGGTFTRGDCPDGSYGYFTNGMTALIPFDPTVVYDYEYYVRKHSGASGSNYFGIIPFDVDGYTIAYNHVMNYNASLFYLSEDLNKGDTVVHFTDLTNWLVNTIYTHQRSFLFFGYKDNTGYTYPDGTYSRKLYRDIYSDNTSVNKTNKTITLKAAWTGETFKAGTCVAQVSDGMTYCYYGQAGSITNTTWARKKGIIWAGTTGGPLGINSRRLLYAKNIRVYLFNSVADYAKISIRERVGVGILSATEYYAVSSSNSTAPSSWSTSVPTMTTTNRYLWNYERTTYTDNTTKDTAKRVIGVYGNTGATGGTGATGNGIKSITNYYLTTTAASGVTTSTSGWSTTPTATTTSKKYMWNYEKITYTNGSTANTTPHIIGTHGATGSQGEPGIDFSQGKMLFTDPTFASGVNSTAVYNNSSNENVTNTRSEKSTDNPMTDTDYELVIKNTGVSSPWCGGFSWGHDTRANAIFVYRIIAKIPTGRALCFASNATGTPATQKWLTSRIGTGKFTEYLFRLECGSSGTFSSTGYFYIDGSVGTSASPVTWYVAYATCFDMTNVSDVQEVAEDLDNTKNDLNDSIAGVESNATSLIEQLEAQISMLITDSDGGSLMTQTEDGWTFNMSSITSNLETIKNEMTNMSDEHASNSSAIDKLTSLVNDVANKTAYITMSTDDDGDPCIELGKTDSKFKVRITNSSIDFLEGSSIIAYVNNNTFYATKLIARNGVQVGEGPGFEWRVRENGNMGLVYVTS